MAIASLMTDHEDLDTERAASPQKPVGAFEQHRSTDTCAVNMSLQALPIEFATREEPDRVPDLALGTAEIAGHKLPLSRGGEKDPIVVDQRIVEVDANAARQRSEGVGSFAQCFGPQQSANR